jgi:hypothetical protein
MWETSLGRVSVVTSQCSVLSFFLPFAVSFVERESKWKTARKLVKRRRERCVLYQQREQSDEEQTKRTKREQKVRRTKENRKERPSPLSVHPASQPLKQPLTQTDPSPLSPQSPPTSAALPPSRPSPTPHPSLRPHLPYRPSTPPPDSKPPPMRRGDDDTHSPSSKNSRRLPEPAQSGR